jgi:hypothetical protein
MDNIISFEQKKAEKSFNRYDDPCSSCTDDKTNCTCEKASLWWNIFANSLKGK